jgi:stage II sporulation protein D
MKTLFCCLVLVFASGVVCRAQDVRISVLSRYRPTQLVLEPSQTQAMVLELSGERLVLEPDSADARAEIRIAAGQLLVAIGDQNLRTKDFHAAGRTGASEFILSVPGKISRHYFGTLTIAPKAGELEVIVTMDLETAVASVVQAETDPRTPMEAVKAQAVVTRSYFVAAKYRHQGFDFCDLAHCQVLRGLPAPGSPAERATQETRGLVLPYEGKPFAAMFTRSCGGRTRTPAEDGLPSNGYPYFSVVCDYCRKHPFRWTRTVSAEDAELLLSKGENGRLELCRRLGWNAVSSNDFVASKDGAGVVLKGRGQGHGIGLCQRGAEAMAAGGANYRAILLHYFPNTSILELAPSPER